MSGSAAAGGQGDTNTATGAAAGAAAGGGTGAAATGAAAAGDKGAAAGAGDTKTGDGGAAAGAAAAGATGGAAADAGKAGGQEPPKAPDKYALTIPKGDEALVHDRVLSHVEQTARAAGWSNDEAQAALEEYLGNVKAELEAELAVTKTDADYGGDKLPETQRLARLALDRIRPAGHPRRDAFFKVITRAGVFNNLEVVAALADLGKQMAEDTGGQATTTGARAARDPAEVLYGGTPKGQGAAAS